MNILCTDDNPMHLNLIQSCIKMVSPKENPYNILGTASNGQDLIKLLKEMKAKGTKIDVLTLDIRMPVLDGLSTLVKVRSFDPSIKITMASSEDEKTVSKQASNIASMPEAEKFALLEKVAQRLIQDKVEPGKINSMLDASEQLHLDPIKIAQKYKANAYLHKPYEADAVREVFSQILTSSKFLIKVK